MRHDHYDEFAAHYDAENASSLLNEYYERPAMITLAGDVDGLDVLDLGCGSGPLAAQLLARGARVTGLDGSAEMLRLARAKLGPHIPLITADLAQPLPFPDGAFDLVSASLVLHYLEDWTGPLSEIRRVLKPGGRVIISVNHPTCEALMNPEANQFAIRELIDTFDFAGKEAQLTFWHRPLSAMAASFVEAGFSITGIDEPTPSPDTPPDLLTPRLRSGERDRFFSFLFFTLQG